VQLGLHERHTGLVCFDNYSARGAKKTEEKLPELTSDIHELLAEKCHADPQLKTPFRYTKVTAAAVLEALVSDKGYAASDLPCRQTMGSLLNRLGYRLKKTQKVKPHKKLPETDAIFAQVASAHQVADCNPKILRLSIDSTKVSGISREITKR
jgi:hypothetical protein